jgi:hypothetical protein
MNKRANSLKGALPRRRGIALLLVLLAMAVASILAYAMLSASALQATAGSNAVTAAAAEAQAESGIHLAAYYLANPNNAPASAGSWSASNITFGSSQSGTMPGSVSVSVSPVVSETNYYEVTATGSVPSATDDQPITRTITAQLQAIPFYQITGAGEFNTSVTIDSSATVTGDVSSSGSITNQGTLTGTPQTNVSPAPAPTSGTLTDYSQPYYYQGSLYYPGTVVATGGTYGPTPTNPLGIYYNTGTLTVTGSMTVNGTLYVKGGSLIVKSTVTINPVGLSQLTYNLPALVVDQYLETNGGNRSFTANGVVCAGSGVSALLGSSSSSITINGALLVTGSGGNVLNNGSVKLNVTYNSSYTNLLTLVANEPAVIKVISWSE